MINFFINILVTIGAIFGFTSFPTTTVDVTPPVPVVQKTTDPTPSLVQKPKVLVTSWAILENKWFVEANQKGWAWMRANNEAGENRYYRKENGVWVRKNSQAEAELPFFIPTPLPTPIPKQTPIPCPPNSYRTGDNNCTCLSNYVVNDTKTGCIIDPQIEELKRLVAEWEQRQKDFNELLKSTPIPVLDTGNLNSIRQSLLVAIQKITSDPDYSKALQQTKISYLGNPQSPTGEALLYAGIKAVCGDMYFSTANNPQGDCSYHGGVMIWVR